MLDITSQEIILVLTHGLCFFFGCVVVGAWQYLQMDKNERK